MSKLFDPHQVVNRPSSSTFDKSQRKLFSAKVGELLPIFTRTVTPGDVLDMNLSSWTQTTPLKQQAFARIKEHFECFFVPFRLLYSQANDMLVKNNELQRSIASQRDFNQLPTSLPYTTSNAFSQMCDYASDLQLTDVKGFEFTYGARKLKEYLGCGNSLFSLMPIFAYQKIYADFYRFQQWEKVNPYTYNADFKTITPYFGASELCGPGFQRPHESDFYGLSPFSLRYVNYNKDYLFGVLPSQINDVYVTSANDTALIDLPFSGNSYGFVRNDLTNNVLSSTEPKTNVALHNFRSQISVLALRQAYATQKWEEIQQASDKNYQDLVYHHFGVKVPDYTANQAQYLGGKSSVIQINEVMNQNFADEAQATRQGKGNGIVDSGNIHFECKEHGIIMVMYHADAVIDYDQRMTINPDCDLLTADDFPQPEFDNIGLEPVTNKYYFNIISSVHDEVLGYAPRYWKFKASLDTVCGNFLTINKSYYLGFQGYADIRRLDYSFFKMSPTIANNVFFAQADSSVDSDVLLVNSFLDCKHSMKLSYYGLPY